VATILATVFFLAVSISIGAADINLRTVWDSVFAFDSSLKHHLIIRELRMPRAMAACLVGACLGTAGAIMQGMTRNPLASPSIMGVNAGAAFALALTLAFFPGATLNLVIVFSILGAAVGAILVYGIGSVAPGGLTPLRLVLAGAAVTALLGALTTGIVIFYEIYQDIVFFYAGGVTGARWIHVRPLIIWSLAGLAGAIILSRSITILNLGDEVAAGLGLRPNLIKAAGSIVVVMLAGAAVAIAGPVGFIGLVIPHIARFLVGVDYRFVIPTSAAMGALLLCLADIGARLVHPTREMPLGMVTALIGVPFFLFLIRRDNRHT
jgi:iron complex transport system permease protein